MSFEPRELLRHVLAEAEYLIQTGTGLTWEQFEQDETLRRAFLRSLEVIGEAVKRLPDSFKDVHPDRRTPGAPP